MRKEHYRLDESVQSTWGGQFAITVSFFFFFFLSFFIIFFFFFIFFLQ